MPGTQFSPDAAHTVSVGLSNGNLTAKQAGLNFASGDQALYGRSGSGKWYFEVTCDIAFSPAVGVIGICDSSANPNNILGGDGHGWSYYAGSGTKIHSNIETAYGATWGVGDRIGVAVDLDNNTIQYSKNGANQGLISYPDLATMAPNGFTPAVSDGSSDSNPAHYVQYTLYAGLPGGALLHLPPGFQPINGGSNAANFFPAS